jgi:protein gp37
VSVEHRSVRSRLDVLRTIPARVRFVSAEPLLGSLADVNLDGIDWLIAGGESGPKARPMREEWVRELRDRCGALSIPFFFKQWGGPASAKRGGVEAVLDGRRWTEFPAICNVR